MHAGNQGWPQPMGLQHYLWSPLQFLFGVAYGILHVEWLISTGTTMETIVAVCGYAKYTVGSKKGTTMETIVPVWGYFMGS